MSTLKAFKFIVKRPQLSNYVDGGRSFENESQREVWLFIALQVGYKLKLNRIIQTIF